MVLKVKLFLKVISVLFLITAPNKSSAEDFIGPAGTPVVTPDSTPVSNPAGKNTLNALMKHPSVPNFDRLRPMSGEWVRCKTAPSPAAGSQQDRFSSSDRRHFTRVTTMFLGQDCKTRLRQTRTSWQCESSTKELLSCKLLKEETGGEGGWSAVKKSDDDLAGSTIKISLKPIGKKTETRKLEIRLRPDAADGPYETETILLTSGEASAKSDKPAKN